MSEKPKLVIRALFEEIFPRLLVAQRERCAAIGASFGFDVGGEGGGAWTLDLAQAAVKPGLHKGAVATLKMMVVDVEAMMAGTLDVDAARREGRIQIAGDAARLPELLSVLAPGPRGAGA